jgi:quinoprotein glucose dehydrogenase
MLEILKSRIENINFYSKPIFLIFLVIFSCSTPQQEVAPPMIQENKEIPEPNSEYANWSIYRGDQKANQYAELAQIHAANVHRLELAWQYRTGDASENLLCSVIRLLSTDFCIYPPRL